MSFNNPTGIDFLAEKWIHNKLAAPLYKGFVNKINLKGDEQVLDFGCGGGACSRHIAEKLLDGGKLTCVDASQPWVDVAKNRMQRYEQVNFAAGDIRILEIDEGIYDIVSIHFVLHDIDSHLRQDIVNALSRKLKQNGQLYIREPIKKSHGMPPEEIRQLMKIAGLEEIHGEVSKSMFIKPMYMGIFKKK